MNGFAKRHSCKDFGRLFFLGGVLLNCESKEENGVYGLMRL